MKQKGDRYRKGIGQQFNSRSKGLKEGGFSNQTHAFGMGPD